MYRSSMPLNSRHWGKTIEEDHGLHALLRSILRLSATGNRTVGPWAFNVIYESKLHSSASTVPLHVTSLCQSMQTTFKTRLCKTGRGFLMLCLGFLGWLNYNAESSAQAGKLPNPPTPKVFQKEAGTHLFYLKYLLIAHSIKNACWALQH